MSIRFDVVNFTIPNGSGPKSLVGNAVFPSNVIDAGSAVNRFNFDFTGADHNMGRIMLDTSVTGIAGPVVTLQVDCQFRDNSGNDDYFGDVSVLVTAEV
jgi:hypothetical protein